MIESIESIHFENFKALRDSTLPLGPCNILVGPNGSGKSTVLQALGILREYAREPLSRRAELFSAAQRDNESAVVRLRIKFAGVPSPAELAYVTNDGRFPQVVAMEQVDEAVVRELRDEDLGDLAQRGPDLQGTGQPLPYSLQ